MNGKQKTAVGYIRMSTDQQQDSPERQRRDIEAMPLKSNYKIIKWYEDHREIRDELGQAHTGAKRSVHPMRLADTTRCGEQSTKTLVGLTNQ